MCVNVNLSKKRSNDLLDLLFLLDTFSWFFTFKLCFDLNTNSIHIQEKLFNAKAVHLDRKLYLFRADIVVFVSESLSGFFLNCDFKIIINLWIKYDTHTHTECLASASHELGAIHYRVSWYKLLFCKCTKFFYEIVITTKNI